jgi:hypothetical protein
VQALTTGQVQIKDDDIRTELDYLCDRISGRARLAYDDNVALPGQHLDKSVALR